MIRSVRMKSGAIYNGETALDIVDQMRRADFDPPDTVREYIARAVARASHYFGITMHATHAARVAARSTDAEVAEVFLKEAIAKGFAEEVTTS